MKKLFAILGLLIITTIICNATSQEDYKQELLEKGWLYGCTPANWSLIEPIRGGFNYAAMNGNVEIMELEKKAGLDITSCGKNLPSVLILKNQPQSMEFLLKNGYNPDDKGLSLSYLNYAIYMKRYDLVNVLLENGANPNLQSGSYYPLNEAIKKKNVDMVKALLKYGAKPNEKTEKLLAKCKNQDILNLFNK